MAISTNAVTQFSIKNSGGTYDNYPVGVSATNIDGTIASANLPVLGSNVAAGIVSKPSTSAGKWLRDDGTWQTIDVGAKSVASGNGTTVSNSNGAYTVGLSTVLASASVGSATTSRSPGSAGVFDVPFIKYDTYGRITSAYNTRITLPTVPSAPSNANGESSYGLVKVSNNYSTTVTSGNTNVAASQHALYNAYNTLNNKISNSNNSQLQRFYMDNAEIASGLWLLVRPNNSSNMDWLRYTGTSGANNSSWSIYSWFYYSPKIYKFFGLIQVMYMNIYKDIYSSLSYSSAYEMQIIWNGYCLYDLVKTYCSANKGYVVNYNFKGVKLGTSSAPDENNISYSTAMTNTTGSILYYQENCAPVSFNKTASLEFNCYFEGNVF